MWRFLQFQRLKNNLYLTFCGSVWTSLCLHYGSWASCFLALSRHCSFTGIIWLLLFLLLEDIDFYSFALPGLKHLITSWRWRPSKVELFGVEICVAFTLHWLLCLTAVSGCIIQALQHFQRNCFWCFRYIFLVF